MKVAKMAWGLLLGGCASAGPRAPGPVTPIEVVEPAREAVRSYAVLGAWAHVGLAAELLPEFSAGDLAMDDQGFATVYAEVPKERLTPRLAALSGAKMRAVDGVGGGCEVVLGRVVVGAQLGESDAGYHALWDGGIYNDEGDLIDERPEKERLAEALAGQTLRVFAELKTASGERFEGCSEDDSVHHVATVVGEPLVEAEASAEMLAAGLLALREHGFWEVQQAGYQRSVELLRERARREFEAEVAEAKKRRASKKALAELEDERDKRADLAPATWEAKPVGPDDEIWGYQEPSGTVWSDARGARFLLVQTGNDVSCAAPRAWMFFQVDGSEGAKLTPLDFGIVGSPSHVVARGGGFDVLTSWPNAVARVGAGRLEVVAPPSMDAAPHCSWGQIPPVQGQPGGRF